MRRGDALPRVRSFAAHGSALREARDFVRERASDDRLPDEATEELVLAVSEAIGNAVAHSDSLLVLVSWRHVDQEIEVQVKDDGVFRNRLATGGDGGLGM